MYPRTGACTKVTWLDVIIMETNSQVKESALRLGIARELEKGLSLDSTCLPSSTFLWWPLLGHLCLSHVAKMGKGFQFSDILLHSYLNPGVVCSSSHSPLTK